MKLKLKKDIIENKNISNEAILVYLGIILCYKNGFDSVLANKSMVNYYLTQKESMSRRFEEDLRDGFKELIDKNIIVCKNKIGSDYYFNLHNIQLLDNDKFIFVECEDIYKIMKTSYKNKDGILRLYLCMIGTFISKNSIKDIRNPEKYNNILGMMSQDYLSKITGLSAYSVIEYTKILEQLELLYVSRCSFTFKDNKGRVKRHNNIYGRYADKELIDEFANIRYEMYDDLHKVQNMSATNTARSLMQKYNYLCSGFTYDKDTIAAIYNYVSEYNENHPKKCRDMSVFIKYGYKVKKDKKVK